MELKNVYFKQALVEFFIRDWASNDLAAFMNNKILYLNFDKCYRYESINHEMLVTQVDALSCPLHEEADTKIIFHVCQLIKEANVTIRCSDTDVLIIMLSNMMYVKAGIKIYMHVGVGRKQRFIDGNKLLQVLGSELCSTLPIML